MSASDRHNRRPRSILDGGRSADESEAARYYALPGLDHGLLQSPVNVLSNETEPGKHLVHSRPGRSADGPPSYLVISILVRMGRPNRFLAEFLDAIPAEPGQSAKLHHVFLGDAFPPRARPRTCPLLRIASGRLGLSGDQL